MIVYKATNTLNQDFYIGITTKSLNQRKKGHKANSKYKQNKNHFHNSIRKYGWENFKWEIIDQANNIDELIKKEIKYIKKLKPSYNSCDGGSRGLYGRKHKEETKIKIGNAHRGKKLKEETKEKISKSNKGKKRDKKEIERLSNLFKGKSHSEETKIKISKTQSIRMKEVWKKRKQNQKTSSIWTGKEAN